MLGIFPTTAITFHPPEAMDMTQNNQNKSGNLDAERSARMAVRHLPGAVHLRRA